MSDHRQLVATRWSMTLSEALLGHDQRRHIEAEFEKLVRDDPDWVAQFFAGLTTDLAHTLPDADPWRHVHVAPNGDTTVAGRPFGTVDDHADLLPVLHVDLLPTDPALCAVAEPLDRRTAQLVAEAFGDRERWAELLKHLAGDPGDLLRIGSDAVRYLAFRRRCLMTRLDEWVLDSAEWWANHLGANVDESEVDERIARETVPDENYLPDADWSQHTTTAQEVAP